MTRTVRHGFTLIELLVVIAIMAILAAILFPVFAGVRARGWQTKCMVQMKQLQQAHQMWVQDHDGEIPNWYYSLNPQSPTSYQKKFGEHPTKTKDPNWIFWPEFLSNYIRDRQILDDPGFQAGRTGNPGEWMADQMLGSWGPGGSGTEDNPYWRWAGPASRTGTGMHESQIVRTSETICFIDGYLTTEVIWLDPKRHRGGVNAVMHDGSARWLPTRNMPDYSPAPSLWQVEQKNGIYRYRFISADIE
ncbi:MAG TPA: prepilin-type N-terminal cleavage/methylation domain-containing protein [Candidatus Obscuribacterales bacterium]